MSPTRILPAEVFDLLNHSAEAFEGIGGGVWYDPSEYGAPYCAWGHARFLREVSPRDQDGIAGVDGALAAAGITVGQNDDAVRRINRRKRVPKAWARVPFEAWATELHVVRGES